MTLIIGARCVDGIVLVADRRVLNSNRLVDKIRKPENVNVIFTAGGIENIFEDYLDDLSRNVDWAYNWIKEENKTHPQSLQREYDFKQFKKTCITTLTDLKETYKNYGESNSFATMLQVFFTLPEIRDGETVTRLYKMDMDDCLPQAVEHGEVAVIGYEYLASPFLKSLENKPEATMKDVARVATFTIKYMEKEDLTEKAVGVGDLEPQIYFIANGQKPRELEAEELKEVLNGVNEEVEKIRSMIGSTSGFLRS